MQYICRRYIYNVYAYDTYIYGNYLRFSEVFVIRSQLLKIPALWGSFPINDVVSLDSYPGYAK